MLTSNEHAIYDDLPAGLRPKYVEQLNIIRGRDARIVAGALEAVECARRKAEHGRLNRV